MAVADPNFGYKNSDITGPALNFAAITPHDSTDLASLTRAIYIGGDGDVVAINATGDAVTFSGLLAGSVLPIRAKRVNSTSTTATNLVALW